MTTQADDGAAWPRRKFLKLSAATAGAVGTLGVAKGQAAEATRDLLKTDFKKATGSTRFAKKQYNGEYAGDRLNRVAFPLGGMGAGMICLEGTGALSHFSLRHKQLFAGSEKSLRACPVCTGL